jgi:transcriptional regulator with XRE-family HTH domain
LQSSESPRVQEAAALRKWFSSQKRFGSWSAMERALNITEDYLYKIKSGDRRAVDSELRAKLHNATGLEIFKPISGAVETKKTDGEGYLLQKTKPQKRAKPYDIPELPLDLSNKLRLALQRLELTISECATKYGISPNTLKKYRRGVRRPSSEKNVEAITTILKDAGVTRRNSLLRIPKNNSFERAIRIKKLLVKLADELEFFKQNSESARKSFRRAVPGEDIGYITTLLRALYNEDQFQRWLLFSEYRMRSKEGD